MFLLILTIGAFFTLVVGTLYLDYLATGTLSGRGLLGSALIAIIIAAWHRYRIKMQARQKAKDDLLRRRALFRQNGGERGEVSGAGLVILSCMVGLALLALSAQFCVGAEPAEDISQIDIALAEASDDLFPAVPLSGKELIELQWLTMRVGVFHKRLEDAAPGMPSATQEKRASIKRAFKKLQMEMTDLQVLQASEVLRATRKGGRP